MHTCLSSSFLPTTLSATFGLLGGTLAIGGAAWIGRSGTMRFLRRARRRPPTTQWIYFLNRHIISIIQFRKGNLPPLKQLQLKRRQQQSAAFLNLVAHLSCSLECLVNLSNSSQCSEHLLASLDCLVHIEILIGCYICPWTLLQDHPRSLPAAFGVSSE